LNCHRLQPVGQKTAWHLGFSPKMMREIWAKAQILLGIQIRPDESGRNSIVLCKKWLVIDRQLMALPLVESLGFVFILNS
jgi:hypothetical protein